MEHVAYARKTPLHVSSTRGTLSLGETPEDEHDEEIYLSSLAADAWSLATRRGQEEFNQVIRSPEAPFLGLETLRLEVRQLLDELDVWLNCMLYAAYSMPRVLRVVEPRPGVFEAFNTACNPLIRVQNRDLRMIAARSPCRRSCPTAQKRSKMACLKARTQVRADETTW